MLALDCGDEEAAWATSELAEKTGELQLFPNSEDPADLQIIINVGAEQQREQQQLQQQQGPNWPFCRPADLCACRLLASLHICIVDEEVEVDQIDQSRNQLQWPLDPLGCLLFAPSESAAAAADAPNCCELCRLVLLGGNV